MLFKVQWFCNPAVVGSIPHLLQSYTYIHSCSNRPIRIFIFLFDFSTGLHCKREAECCANCKELIASISECGVCLEPLDHGITSCQTCGNLVCTSCAGRLLKCPFCRITIDYSWQRNVALERIFMKLELPCRNFRWFLKLTFPKPFRGQTHLPTKDFGRVSGKGPICK